jgi:hypothetical protein
MGSSSSENTPERLVLRSGGTTLVLDKEAGAASLRRKTLWWDHKPISVPLADICDVAVMPAIDRSAAL